MIRIENPKINVRIAELGLTANADGSFTSGRRTYPREAVILIALEDKTKQRHMMLERLKCIVASGVAL